MRLPRYNAGARRSQVVLLFDGYVPKAFPANQFFRTRGQFRSNNLFHPVAGHYTRGLIGNPLSLPLEPSELTLAHPCLPSGA
jgi:hypothetical protein